MRAYRTDFRGFRSNYNMSTVAAFPYLHFALLKHLRSFNVLKKCTISLHMVLFNFSYCSKFCCKLRETFFLCCFSKAIIHICPLVRSNRLGPSGTSTFLKLPSSTNMSRFLYTVPLPIVGKNSFTNSYTSFAEHVFSFHIQRFLQDLFEWYFFYLSSALPPNKQSRSSTTCFHQTPSA